MSTEEISLFEAPTGKFSVAFELLLCLPEEVLRDWGRAGIRLFDPFLSCPLREHVLAVAPYPFPTPSNRLSDVLSTEHDPCQSAGVPPFSAAGCRDVGIHEAMCHMV